MVDLGPNYDFTLTFNGASYGIMLYVDPQTGQKHWGEGISPLMTPQQRTTAFSYEHVPPEIDVPASFENWSEGAGYTEHLGEGNAPRGYNYSRGLDFSWGTRGYQSPARQADNASTGGAIAAAPVLFWYSSTFGLWCMASTTLYKYDLTTNTWVSKDTASAAYTSAAELNGVMYVSINGLAYHYSTDGNTWTTATLGGTLTNDIADLFVVRNASLWAMRLEALYTTTNGQNGGVNWGGPTAIGSTSESTKSMVVANGDIWMFKREGIYTYDGTTVSQVWVPKFLSSTNGTYAYVHSDGVIYVVYNTMLLGVDPFNTTDAPLRVVYPNIAHDTQEIKGTISQVSGNFHELFFTVTNPMGRVYLMKLSPGSRVAHTYAYLSTNANAACIVVGAGVMHSTNPCLATGYGTAAVHYILPRADMRPEDDVYYEYDTAEGEVIGSWIDYGARAFPKFLNQGTILGLNVTAGQPIALHFYKDEEDNHNTLLSAVDSNLTSANVTSEVSFYRLRYHIHMSAVSEVQSPILLGATLHATLNPPRRRIWRPVIHLKANGQLRDGQVDTQDPSVVREALVSGVTKRATMVDRHNRSYVVRLLDMQEQFLVVHEQGSDERDSQVFQLTIAEIYPQGSGSPAAVYGDDAYGGGKVFA